MWKVTLMLITPDDDVNVMYRKHDTESAAIADYTQWQAVMAKDPTYWADHKLSIKEVN